VPLVASPPVMLLTDQVTSLFAAPVTVAEKVCDWPMRTFAPAGEITTLEFDPPPEPLPEPPPEPPPDPPDEPLLPLLVAPQPAATIIANDAQTTSNASVNLGERFIRRFVVLFFNSRPSVTGFPPASSIGLRRAERRGAKIMSVHTGGFYWPDGQYAYSGRVSRIASRAMG
jgi:hypothetical protein